MKKTLLILIAGILLITGAAYAADGDLYVAGKTGLGTDEPNARLDVQYENSITENGNALKVTATKSTDSTWFNGSVISAQGNSSTNASILGLSISSTSNTINAQSGGIVGATGIVMLKGSGNITSTTGFVNGLRLQTGAGNYDIGAAKGQEISLVTGADNGTHDITYYYGLYSRGAHNGSGTVSGTDWRHAYFEDFPYYGGTVDNVAGLWIDQQTLGTDNYGIVLAGNEDGADIVFGPNQEARIFSKQEMFNNPTGIGIWVEDEFNNQTQITPHDPETGEWIFYSKNTKTGRTVKVNMEELVRDIEKLTGKTYLIESFVKEK